MSLLTEVIPYRPFAGAAALLGGAALHSGVGALEGMAVSAGGASGALFGLTTYLIEQATRPIFPSMIERCQGLETHGQFLAKALTVVSWIVPRLAGLAACAYFGFAFGAWQAIALAVMNFALPFLLARTLVSLREALTCSSAPAWLGVACDRLFAAVFLPFAYTGVAPIINEVTLDWDFAPTAGRNLLRSAQFFNTWAFQLVD